MQGENFLLKLKEDIHASLKSWHDTGKDFIVLDYLQLYRQARLSGTTSPRRATNDILLDALDRLALEHEDNANLLRRHFLDGMLMHAIANRLNIGQSTAYRKQQEAIHQLAVIIQAKENQAREVYQASLEKRLRLPSEAHLFGVEEQLRNLLEQVVLTESPWLISIEGLGGIGKTALANSLARRTELINRFHEIAWVSAKQQSFLPGMGLEEKFAPALTVEALIDALLEQFGQCDLLNQSSSAKREGLISLLRQSACLIVIDNLETIADYQTLLPILGETVNPSKVLLTSRHSVRAFSDIYCVTLEGLSQVDTFELIKHEAHTRGLFTLAKASEAQLRQIYDVVGGNPLALKLVIGQSAFLPLSQVLDSLVKARGKGISELYTHIYWQAWEMLDDISRQTLLVMPAVEEGTLKQLQFLSQLEAVELYQALQQLATLSLIQVEGNLEERRYSTHRLTETFLLNQAITWQSSA